MYLKYYINENGERIYTLNKFAPDGKVATTAHPARFSPDDHYSQQRYTIKSRFRLLKTQSPPPVY